MCVCVWLSLKKKRKKKKKERRNKWPSHPHLAFGGGQSTPIWPEWGGQSTPMVYRGGSVSPKGPNGGGRNHPQIVWRWLSHLHLAKGVADPPPSGHVATPFFFIFNADIFRINMCIWGNFKKFAPKNARAVHMSHFLSKTTEMANIVLTLKNSETLLGYENKY
jgi:hypothetical protein